MAGRRGNNEGSVYQERSTGRWVAAVSVDGKRRRAIAKTEAAAKRRLREMLAQVDSGLPVTHGSITVAKLLDDWMATAVAGKNLSPRTVDTHRWAVQVLKADLGRKRIKQLRPEDVEAAFTRLATVGHGGSGRPLSRSSLVKVSVRSRAGPDMGGAPAAGCPETSPGSSSYQPQRDRLNSVVRSPSTRPKPCSDRSRVIDSKRYSR